MDQEKTAVMDAPLNPDYEAGMRELAEMLSQIPENIRGYLVANFVKNIAKM